MARSWDSEPRFGSWLFRSGSEHLRAEELSRVDMVRSHLLFPSTPLPILVIPCPVHFSMFYLSRVDQTYSRHAVQMWPSPDPSFANYHHQDRSGENRSAS